MYIFVKHSIRITELKIEYNVVNWQLPGWSYRICDVIIVHVPAN